jgi:hypothetical protein
MNAIFSLINNGHFFYLYVNQDQQNVQKMQDSPKNYVTYP